MVRYLLPAVALAALAPAAALGTTFAPAYVSPTCAAGEDTMPASITHGDGTAITDLGLRACHSPTSGMVQLAAYDTRGGVINNDDLHDLGITTTTTLRLEVTLPVGTTRQALIIGGGIESVTYDGATRILTVTATPRRLSYALFTPCGITGCDVDRADVTWAAALNGAVMTDVAPGNPAVSQMVAPISGSWVATTAQAFGVRMVPKDAQGADCAIGPVGDCVPSFVVDLAGPHREVDGVTLNRAELTAFLPTALLSGMQATAALALYEKTGGGATTTGSCTNATDGKICSTVTHFSAPSFFIRSTQATATTPGTPSTPGTTPSTPGVTPAPSLRPTGAMARAKKRSVTVQWKAATPGLRYRVTLRAGARTYVKTVRTTNARFPRVAPGRYVVTITPVTPAGLRSADQVSVRIRVR